MHYLSGSGRKKGANWLPISAFLILLMMVGNAAAHPTGRQILRNRTPAAVAKLAPLGHLNSVQTLNLAISLPLRNQNDLTQFLAQVSDPKSPQYRHYLTPAQFTENFGPTEADYNAVIAFAKAQGLKVTGTHSNRMIVDVQGTVPVVEKAFNLRMYSYQHPTENRKFFAPDAAPSVNLDVPLLDIVGLDNFLVNRVIAEGYALVDDESLSRRGNIFWFSRWSMGDART